MSSQGEEGWPLGLPPVTLRMRLVEAFSAAGAGEAGTSFVLNATPSFSSLSSSDLDTESTAGSFFPEKTITLGSLIGIAGGASSGHPSFRRSLQFVDDTSSMQAGPHSLIARFPWRRNEPSGGATGTTKSSSWSNLIRCRSCRGAYDYPDDDSSIGAPPSLGHFLDRERDLEITSNNQAKVYINVMFEEDEQGSHEAEVMNPLFNSGRASFPSSTSNLMNSNLPSAVNNLVHSSCLRTDVDANGLQDHMSTVQSCNPPKQRHEAIEQDEELLRLQAAAKSMQTLQRAATLLKSKSQRQQQGQSGNAGICILSCVSHIWGASKRTSNRNNHEDENDGDDDVDSQFTSEERECEAKFESSTPLNHGISCYTNFSFDDSDCSVYFDDEDEPNMSTSKSREANTTDGEDAHEFEFCSPMSKGSGTS